MRKKLLFPVLSIILICLLGILALDQHQVGEEAASNR